MRLILPPRHLALDGFNIFKAGGSGIATYGRNLGQTLAGLGYRTDLICGPVRKPGRNNLLNEVALYDSPDASTGPSKLKKFIGNFISTFGRDLVPVSATGEVIGANRKQTFHEQMWAAQDVFHTANRSYARTKGFTPVHFKAPSSAPAPELVHWTAPLPLWAPRRRNIYTLHDLVPLRLPSATLDNKGRFYALCKRICRDADHVVTVSDSAKSDIMRIFGISEDRITNTYQSVSIPRSLTSQSEDVVATELEGVFGLGWRRYLLFFGAIEPKKNIGRLIQAYLGSGITDPLVIVGGKGWSDKAETQLLYEDIVQLQAFKDNILRRADRVRRYDYMPFPMLISLIRGAKATLFPSLYEGFGLPVLESMVLGTPVLTSTAGSLPEVAGEAAILVDPYDTQSIRRGIQALDADEGLRIDLAARGRVNAMRFSPEAYQANLASLYDRLF